jgi:hypothetical protein
MTDRATKPTTPLSDAVREELIERAKRELPALTEQATLGIRNLERISKGLRPRRV